MPNERERFLEELRAEAAVKMYGGDWGIGEKEMMETVNKVLDDFIEAHGAERWEDHCQLRKQMVAMGKSAADWLARYKADIYEKAKHE